MEQKLKLEGLKRHEIAKSGNCLFDSFAHQMNLIRPQGPHGQLNAAGLRALFCRIIDSSPDLQTHMFLLDNNLNRAGLDAMRLPGHFDEEWCDQALNVLAVYYNVRVKVFHPDGRVVVHDHYDDPNIFNPIRHQYPHPPNDAAMVKLIYSPDHYDSTEPDLRVRQDRFPNAKFRSKDLEQAAPILVKLMETLANDPVLCKPVKGGLKAVKSVKKSQMQLLGVSGVGKSTMIDTSVRDALVSPSKYTDMNAEIKASLGDGRWKHGVTALKLVPGDTSSDLAENVEKVNLIFPNETPEEAKNAQDDMLAYEKSIAKLVKLRSFLLPVGEKKNEATTTAHIMRVHAHDLFQTLFHFHSEKDMKAEIKTCLDDLQNPEEEDHKTIGLRRQRLKALTGKNLEECLLFQEQHPDQSLLRNELRPLAAEQWRLYSGLGKDLNQDRYFIKTQLKNLTLDADLIVAVSSVDIMVPSDIPTLVDNPGVADPDFHKNHVIQEALDEADIVMLVIDEQVSRSSTWVDFFASSALFHNLLRDPTQQNTRLAITFLYDRDVNLDSLEELTDDMVEIQEGSKVGLERCLLSAIDMMTANSSYEHKAIQEMKDRASKVVAFTKCLVACPLSYASLKQEKTRMVKRYGEEPYNLKLKASRGADLLDFIYDVQNYRALQSLATLVQEQKTSANHHRAEFKSLESIIRHLQLEVETHRNSKDEVVAMSAEVIKLAKAQYVVVNGSSTKLSEPGRLQFDTLLRDVFNPWKSKTWKQIEAAVEALVRERFVPLFEKAREKTINTLPAEKKFRKPQRARTAVFKALKTAVESRFEETPTVDAARDIVLEQSRSFVPDLKKNILTTFSSFSPVIRNDIGSRFDTFVNKALARLEREVNRLFKPTRRKHSTQDAALEPRKLVRSAVERFELPSNKVDKTVITEAYEQLLEDFVQRYLLNVKSRFKELSDDMQKLREISKHKYPLFQYVVEKFHYELKKSFSHSHCNKNFQTIIDNLEAQIQTIRVCRTELKTLHGRLSANDNDSAADEPAAIKMECDNPPPLERKEYTVAPNNQLHGGRVVSGGNQSNQDKSKSSKAKQGTKKKLDESKSSAGSEAAKKPGTKRKDVAVKEEERPKKKAVQSKKSGEELGKKAKEVSKKEPGSKSKSKDKTGDKEDQSQKKPGKR